MSDVYKARSEALKARGRAEASGDLASGIGQAMQGAADVSSAWRQISAAQNHRDVTQGLSKWSEWKSEVEVELENMNEQDRHDFIEQEWSRIESGEHPMFQGIEFRNDRAREEFQRIAREKTAAWANQKEIEAIRELNQSIEYDTIQRAEDMARRGDTDLAMLAINTAVAQGHMGEVKGQQEIDRIMGDVQRDALYEHVYDLMQEEGEQAALDYLESDQVIADFGWDAMTDVGGDGQVLPSQRSLDEDDIAEVKARLQGRKGDEQRIRQEFVRASHNRTYTDWETALNEGTLTYDMLATAKHPETGELLRDLHPDLFDKYTSILWDMQRGGGSGSDEDMIDPTLQSIYDQMMANPDYLDEDIIDQFFGPEGYLTKYRADPANRTEDGQFIVDPGIPWKLEREMRNAVESKNIERRVVEDYRERVLDLNGLSLRQQSRLLSDMVEMHRAGREDAEIRDYMESAIEREVITAGAQALERDQAIEDMADDPELGMTATGGILNFSGSMIGQRPGHANDYERGLLQLQGEVQHFSRDDLMSIARASRTIGGTDTASFEALREQYLGGPITENTSLDQRRQADAYANLVIHNRRTRRDWMENISSDRFVQAMDPRTGETVIVDFREATFESAGEEREFMAMNPDEKLRYLNENPRIEHFQWTPRVDIHGRDDRGEIDAAEIQWHVKSSNEGGGGWTNADPTVPSSFGSAQMRSRGEVARNVEDVIPVAADLRSIEEEGVKSGNIFARFLDATIFSGGDSQGTIALRDRLGDKPERLQRLQAKGAENWSDEEVDEAKRLVEEIREIQLWAERNTERNTR